MKRTRKIIALILSLMLVVTMSFAITGCGNESSENNESKTINKKALDSDMDAVLNLDGLNLSGMAVVAVKDDKIVYEYGGGYRYIDNDNPDNNKPYEPTTRQRIASVSKTFVAVGIMQQVEKGKIDLDTDVSDYLGFTLRNPNFHDTPITCKMLLSHTSSLRDGEAYSIEPQYALSEFFLPNGKYYEDGDHFAGKGQAPGEYFSYANINFAVLATIIECVSGERFDQYETKHIFKPMGIGASYTVSDFSEKEMDNLAATYGKEWDKNGAPIEGSDWVPIIDDYNGEVQPANTTYVTNPDSGGDPILASLDDYKIGTNASCFNPAGGLRISAHELGEYIQMWINDGTAVTGKQILTKKSVDEMFTPVWTWNGEDKAGKTNGDFEYGLFACWGLGIQIITNGKYYDGYGDTFLKDSSDLNLAGHYGDAYNAFSIFMVDREGKTGFAYTVNGSEVDIYSELCYGKFSENWIWEEMIVKSLYKNIF